MLGRQGFQQEAVEGELDARDHIEDSPGGDAGRLGDEPRGDIADQPGLAAPEDIEGLPEVILGDVGDQDDVDPVELLHFGWTGREALLREPGQEGIQ